MAALAKPTGPLLLAVLLLVVLATHIVPRWRTGHTLRAALAILAAGTIAVLSAYAWMPPRTYGSTVQGGPDAIGAARWLWRVWKSYWGTPGYLDYWLPNGWYVALTALWLVNVSVASRKWISGLTAGGDATERAAPLVFAAAALFAGAIIAGSLASIPGLGFSVQGRYLLPVGLGLAAVLVHRRPPAAWALVACLVLFHLALAHESVVRYFGGDYALLLRSLPWR